MTTVDRLDEWKAAGIITDVQHSALTALVRRERFSVFVELSALLYLGVLFVVGQYKNPFLDTLAAELGAKILELDPLAEDYLRILRAAFPRGHRHQRGQEDVH